MDQPGSGSCEMVVLSISGVDPSDPATRVNFLMLSIGIRFMGHNARLFPNVHLM